MADNAQVYLWYKGQYYPTKLAQVNSDGYQLTGWYDNFRLRCRQKGPRHRCGQERLMRLLQRPAPHTAAAALAALPAPVPLLSTGCWGTSRACPDCADGLDRAAPCTRSMRLDASSAALPGAVWTGQPRPTDTSGLVRRAILRAKYQGAPWTAVELGVEMAAPALWQRDQNDAALRPGARTGIRCLGRRLRLHRSGTGLQPKARLQCAGTDGAAPGPGGGRAGGQRTR